MIGVKKRIWSRGWSRDHTRRPIMSQNASCYLVFGLTRYFPLIHSLTLLEIKK